MTRPRSITGPIRSAATTALGKSFPNTLIRSIKAVLTPVAGGRNTATPHRIAGDAFHLPLENSAHLPLGR